MTIKTEIWVAAHVRRCFAAGLTAVIARKGAPEAGAVYMRIVRRDHSERLLVPPPGPAHDEQGRRRWLDLFAGEMLSASKVDDYLARQLENDPDIWVIEVEDRDGQALIDHETIEVM